MVTSPSSKGTDMTKIQIILLGSGGELDRQIIDVRDDSAEISREIMEAIDAWPLMPGDIIKIVEVS
jgi:hypothetical protein